MSPQTATCLQDLRGQHGYRNASINGERFEEAMMIILEVNPPARFDVDADNIITQCTVVAHFENPLLFEDGSNTITLPGSAFLELEYLVEGIRLWEGKPSTPAVNC